MTDFWTIHKRWLLPALAFILAIAIFYTTGDGQAVLTASAARELPIYCVEKDSKVCSLTFDAAWGDVRARHSLEWFATTRLIRIPYHKNSPCYGSGSSITRRFVS